jgi:hypothetical protein
MNSLGNQGMIPGGASPDRMIKAGFLARTDCPFVGEIFNETDAGGSRVRQNGRR